MTRRHNPGAGRGAVSSPLSATLPGNCVEPGRPAFSARESGPSNPVQPRKSQPIIQGEYLIGGHSLDACPVSISTVLGSCVAVCLYDHERRQGGMNHFMLPEPRGSTLRPASFGVHAMELLINALIKAGSARKNLSAQVFGGATMIGAGSFDIGQRNAEFIIGFLNAEAINCKQRDLGGKQARRVEFLPDSGQATCRKIDKFSEPSARAPVSSGGGGAIELF